MTVVSVLKAFMVVQLSLLLESWALRQHSPRFNKAHRGIMKVTSLRMSSSPSTILRRVDKWACVSGCGACCKLGPLESRPDLGEYLTPEEMTTYKSLIGPDDWCVNFDKDARLCTIYDKRPAFCIVSPDKMKTMFAVEEDEINDFAAFCCREHISDNYGENSIELERFEAVLDELYAEDEEDGFVDLSKEEDD